MKIYLQPQGLVIETEKNSCFFTFEQLKAIGNYLSFNPDDFFYRQTFVDNYGCRMTALHRRQLGKFND